jgi:predicted ATPase
MGHCYEDVSLPYQSFVEAFREYVKTRPGDALRHELGPGAPEIATLLPELRPRFPDIPFAPPLEGEAERLRLFESITAFVRGASGSRPVVLFLDDLHWADRSSLQLLRALARGTVSQRVLIVGTYRDVEVDPEHPLAETLAALRRETTLQRLLLRELSEDDVSALLSALDDDAAGKVTGSRTLASAIHRETEGNPFFVRELLSNLVEEGKLYVRQAAGRAVSPICQPSASQGHP